MTNDPAVFQTNFNSLMHAAIDGNIRFVPAYNKLTKRDVMLLCFVNTVQAPPVIIGGPGRLIEQRVPVCEFTLDDAMDVYTPIIETTEPAASETPLPGNVVEILRPGRVPHLVTRTPEPGTAGNVVEEPDAPSAA